MKTIWRETCSLPSYKPLSKDIQTGTAIIGGGLAGLLTAYLLSESGVPCVVLEARQIGSGQTNGTTAKITAQHGLTYSRLIQTFGRRDAHLYATAQQQAIRQYRHMIEHRGIDCEFRDAAAFLYSNASKEILLQEASAARQLGIDAEITLQTELPFPVRSALRFAGQAHFNPLLFLKGLIKNLEIYEETPALAVNGATISTPDGTVTARHIVFACHYPFIRVPGFYFARMYQERSSVIALRPVPAMEGMYLGIDPDGLSFRTAGEYLLLGGSGHRTGMTVPDPFQPLLQAASQYYPGAKAVARWSAQDCTTLDGVPFIGRFSVLHPNWYVATGFRKWGMTSSMVAAQLISRQILGDQTSFDAVFSPQRLRLRASCREWFTHVSVTSRALARGFFSSDRRCPHMGCRLSWNPYENIWECPCHGSCFSARGQLLSGPAQTSIAKKTQ